MKKIIGAAHDPEVCPKTSRARLENCLSEVVEARQPEPIRGKNLIQIAFYVAGKKEQLCEARDSCKAKYA